MSDENKVEENVTDTAPEAAAAPEQGQQIELTVQDLASLKAVIDVASQRGAFKPGEMATVGTVYNKLEAFLNAVQAQQGSAQGE